MSPSFVYSPSIQAHLQVASGTIYDVSDDITSFTVGRIVNGVSSVTLNLQNTARKYDNVFAEMDKVAVYLTRIKKLLVLTGYLDVIPAFSSSPATVKLTGSCTLKRQQNWFWDPTTAPAQKLLYNASNDEKFDMTDGGLATKTIDLLTQVVGWPKAQIHIGAIPEGWFDAIAGVANKIISEASQLSMIAEVGTSGYVSGSNKLQEGTQTIPGVGKGTGTLTKFSGNIQIFNQLTCMLDKKAAQPSGAYYVTMPWPYLDDSNGPVPVAAKGVNVTKARAWWMGRSILLVNPKNGKGVCAKACGWGPNDKSGFSTTIGSASQQVLLDLGAGGSATQLKVNVAFAPDDMKLGLQSGTADQKQATGLASDSTGPTAVQFADVAAEWALAPGSTYLWDGGHPADASNPHPTGMDCSGLCNWALARIGKNQVGSSKVFASTVKKISLAEAKKTKGALMFLSTNSEPSGTHHVGISMGDGTTAEARTEGPGGVGTYPFDGAHSNSWNFAGLLPSLDYNGAQGTGTGGKAGSQTKGGGGGTGTGTGTGTDGGSTSLDGQIGTALFNVWQWTGAGNSFEGVLLSGARALMNDEPVLNTVDSLMTAGLRQYCSAPNGDFIAWFPDYFGWWGTAAKMIIQPVEILENFSIARSDQNLRTHWFVTSATTGVEGAGDATTTAQEYSTAGIASVEMPDLMKALFRVGTEFDDNGAAFLSRFGARPQFEPMDNISGHRQEFFFSVFRFMLNWATRYTCNISLTFMPELYPGMLAVFPSYGLQCYVQEVHHQGDLRASGQGFTTSFTGIAWSSIGNASKIDGLPVGASL